MRPKVRRLGGRCFPKVSRLGVKRPKVRRLGRLKPNVRRLGNFIPKVHMLVAVAVEGSCSGSGWTG
jgi:hypothetical protein